MESHVIDGVGLVFQLTPETEAPAEMNSFHPAVLNLAENGCHTMHNLCPMRGAPTRDALAWPGIWTTPCARSSTELTLLSRNITGQLGAVTERGVCDEQRDMYRYLHDQTLLMGHGLTPNELAEEVALPPACSSGTRAPITVPGPQCKGYLRTLHGALRWEPSDVESTGAK